MARNYMQDITPPEDEPVEPEAVPHLAPERSIRNIQPTPARVRLTRSAPPRPVADVEKTPRTKRWGVWIAALISILFLGGAAALVFLPSTTISIVPHTQVVPLDIATSFTALPSGNAPADAILYTIVSQVFEDSAVVPAGGVERVEEKATGVVTVYNEYSDSPVRLIKNTRFQAANGLIFRIPASVDVPARKGTTPGSITVTIFADQVGADYNLPPQDKFTLPGLKSTPDMYAKVYAKSTAAFAGGFVGDRPAVPQATLDAARSEVRGRISEKAQQLVATVTEESFAFASLMNIVFETLPPTNEPGGGVRIHEKAMVSLPVFPKAAFSQSIARAVSANAEGQSITLRFAEGVTASASSTLAQGELGQKPLIFSLSGTAQLIWNVDSAALSQALAGKEESACQTIIQGVPAVDEARARITPF
ncbi:MAG: hypothetical protein WAZ27_01690, partial [Minisyncoccia bacterium]